MIGLVNPITYVCNSLFTTLTHPRMHVHVTSHVLCMHVHVTSHVLCMHVHVN